MARVQQQNRLKGHASDALIPDLCRGEGLLAVVVIAEVLAILIVIADWGLNRFDWVQLGLVSMLALWITLLSALVLCKTRNLLTRLGAVAAACVSYLAILLVALVCSAIAQWAMVWWGASTEFDGWQLLEVLLLTALPAGILLRYLYLQQKLRVQQKAELESRIQALQSRIKPHFLFNSMNMIASLIGSDPDKAEQVVEDLSDLFRYALSESQTLVPLRDELSLCRRYLALEGLRLGPRLKVDWEIGDYGDNVRIPCLTLQPVLENAIYHGIQLQPEGGKVAISVQREENTLVLSVSNPKTEVMGHHKGNRLALSNIQHRLSAHFGRSASVTASEQYGCYVTVIRYSIEQF